MFTLCILFTTLATNTYRVCVKGHQTKPPNLKILPQRDPPVLKFLDPALSNIMFLQCLPSLQKKLDLCLFVGVMGDELVCPEEKLLECKDSPAMKTLFIEDACK